jgi:hypothetical protein
MEICSDMNFSPVRVYDPDKVSYIYKGGEKDATLKVASESR